MTVKKIAICTGGGDCPGLNAVIRSVVKVGRDKYGWEVLGIEDALHGLLDLDYRSPHGNRWLETSDVRDILTRGGTILGTSNRCDPFRYVVPDESGNAVETDVSARLLENYASLGIDALVSIGGDGSMMIAQRLIDLGLKVVGVPKTIDNDLGCTDQTFGFDTAVNVATEAIDRLRDTADSHDRVIFIEVMGRNAGWIALHAGIAGGADAILLPEIPYDTESIAKMITTRRAAGKNYSLIVVAEGAKPHGGDVSVGEVVAGGMPRLMGAAQRLATALDGKVDAEMRVTVLGHIQRGGSPSAYDRVLATRYGVEAAELIARGEFGRMVALREGRITNVPIEDAIAEPKRVSPDGELVRQASEAGVHFGRV
ncbi:MAG: 6-phosphofructokinase [Sandaracinaceae bacterium]